MAMAAAAITNVSVNFIFANFERKVQLETTLSSSGNDLKTLLIQNWPEGVPICEDRSRIRMICMGNGYLTDDKILGPKFPVFSHPTPINISIRPIQGPSKSFISLLSNDAAAANSSSHRPGVSNSNTDMGQACASRQRDNMMSSSASGRGGGCCTVS